jgi:hypothetical protein
MARFVDVIDLPLSPIAAFDYLAEFQHTAEWDPGVIEASALDPAGPLGPGSRFSVVASFFGRRVPLEYEITDFEPPHRVVLRGTNGSLVAIDTISFAPIPDGTRVTWEAVLEASGLARLADPLLHLLFQHTGRAAVRGLRERADAMASEQKRVARRRRPSQAALRDLSRADG